MHDVTHATLQYTCAVYRYIALDDDVTASSVDCAACFNVLLCINKCVSQYVVGRVLTLYCPYLYSYPIGIPLIETRLTSPLRL